MKRAAFCVFPLAAVIALAAPPAKEDEELVAAPSHLVELYWDIGKGVTVDQFSIDVDVSDDVDAEQRLFIAPLDSRINEQEFYAGLLTDLEGRTRKDPNIRRLGPGATFRRWGKRGQENVRPPVGGCFLDSDHEGDLVDVSVPYKWKKGKYTLKMIKMDIYRGKSESHVWIGAFLYSHESAETLFIGGLRFSGEGLQLSHKIGAFVELYEKPVRVRDIPAVTLKLSNLRLNDRVVENPSIRAFYPAKGPVCADVERENDVVTVKVRPINTKRAERVIELINKKGEASPPGSRNPVKADTSQTAAKVYDASVPQGGMVGAKFYDSYFVSHGARAGERRCAVTYWNLTGRRLSLTVEGEACTLPAGQSLRRELNREFSWHVEGREQERERVPADEFGLEIVIRN